MADEFINKLYKDGKLVREWQDQEAHASQVNRAQDILRVFLDEVVTPITQANDKFVAPSDIADAIQHRIDALDKEITAELTEVIQSEKFKKLEASWRGLAYLVYNTETGPLLKIRVLPVSKDELLADLGKAVDFDQSSLFKKVYEEEYGTFGGSPYSMLVGDYAFKSNARDIKLLEMIANVAAAAHAPFLSSPDPALFDMDDFTQLGEPRDLSKVFDSVDMASWKSFRNSEDSRYVALLMPRVLMRLPWGGEDNPVEGFPYEEGLVESSNDPVQKLPDHKGYLWGNPAYVMAQKIGYAYSLYGWTAAIRGVEGGGKVTGLPLHTFVAPEGDKVMKCPTEVTITDRREKELSDLGFISLVHCKNTDYAAFFGGQTVNKAKLYNTAEANANARLSAMLPYMLNASRFAHYIKVIMRDKVGSFQTKGNIQTYLNTWIMDYVLVQDEAGQAVKAKYPLREARIDVTDIPGQPGCYNAVVFLRPHFQLEELTASIRLVAALPAPAA